MNNYIIQFIVEAENISDLPEALENLLSQDDDEIQKIITVIDISTGIRYSGLEIINLIENLSSGNN